MTDQRYPRSNLAACCLPWTEDYQLDVPAFERHVQGVVEDGFESLYVMGTAGEGYAVSDAQFRQVVDVFASLTRGDRLRPQVGVINLSMQTILERIEFAHGRGIEMFQLSLPSWGALDDQELLLFFRTVCNRFPDCRFLHYNLPRTKRVLTGSDYRRLADAVPNLVATKNSSYDYARTSDLMRRAPDLQHFLLEGNYAMGCAWGPCSLLCSVAPVLPDLAHRFFDAGVRNDAQALDEIPRYIHRYITDVFAHCERSMIDGAYDKAMVWLRDSRFPYRLLPPYLPMSPGELDECRRRHDALLADQPEAAPAGA